MKRRLIVFSLIIVFISLAFMADNENRQEITTYKISSAKASRGKRLFNRRMDIDNVNIVAHRALGFEGVENSLEAIQSSINNKVSWAEIDVQETRDGVVVLMHDRNLKRLTGLDRYVDQMDYHQMDKLNLAAFSPKNGVERVATLDSVMKACSGKMNLIIEIKPLGNIKDLTRNVVKLIDKNNFVSQCKVHSIDYEILLDVKKLNPHIQTGYIVSQPTRNLSSMKVDFYSIQKNIVNRGLVDNIHYDNKEIYVWAVDRPNEIIKMLRLNVDGIISDKPKILLNMKNPPKLPVPQ